MQEKIGQVTLDYTYYPGEDLYSDGPVEEELLELANNYREEELNQEIARRKSWPVLYHFSHIRQNILEWLPIKKTDRILEIGAGCGAITGALAKKGKSVTCIDLSRMRSKINAYRNRDHENIRILVGNFQDIEQNLTETYDYITLIGVFEYSQGYIGTKDPYVEMLRRVSGHLAPGGRLVIAIENRLGLKYWAGCTEDHLGTFFDGLEGYPKPSGVRTFSRSELQELIRRAGDFRTIFYYPYPDYKFPLRIYSDAYLPQKGELTENFRNYDRARVQLFDEPKVYDTLAESGLFPEFSNSFLVLAEKVQEEP
ncbi:MAG: class I SAM-dependent methyltransferase [Blautia sp.]|nr:class I SAM-dependent methyltransferase [Blautia sp.]